MSEQLRSEKLSLFIGQMVGQISELLNQMSNNPKINISVIYTSLKDITQVASLQIHELYYKGNKQNE